MLNKLIRNMILGILFFICTLLVFFISYKIAYKNSFSRIENQMSHHSHLASAQAEETANSKTINPDYFIARYNGTHLSVFSVSDGKEEFLYTLNVRIEDISPNELNDLKNGIRLPTKEALASFEEDFTS